MSSTELGIKYFGSTWILRTKYIAKKYLGTKYQVHFENVLKYQVLSTANVLKYILSTFNLTHSLLLYIINYWLQNSITMI